MASTATPRRVPKPPTSATSHLKGPPVMRRPPYRFHVVKRSGKWEARQISTWTREEAEAWVRWFEANRAPDSEEKWEVRE